MSIWYSKISAQHGALSQSVRHRFHGVLTSAIPFLLISCSAAPMSPSVALAQSPEVSADPSEDATEQVLDNGPSEANQSVQPSSMDGQLMFELMIAELAGRRGQLDVAMEGYLRASERTDDVRVSERATRLAMYGRRWPEAEQSAKRWLQLDPAANDANQILALAVLKQGKSDEGAALYVDMINRADDKDRALRQVQAELASLDNPAQAIQVMEGVLQSYGESAQAHLSLARLKLSANDRQAALQSVEDALQFAPNNPGAFVLKAQILVDMGRPDEGFAVLDEVVAANPDQLSLRLAYAQMQVQTGRYDGVEQQLDRLFSSAQDDPDTLLTISLLALDARRIDRARTYLMALLDTGEYPDQANFYLARISDQQQDYQTAIN